MTLWSVAGLVAFYLLARSLALVPRAAATATALLAVSTFYLLMTRRLMTDIPLLCCALWSAALVLRGHTIPSGLFAGLAVLAKGVAAAPMLAAVYGFALFTRQLRARELLFGATLAGLAVAAPWHIAVSLRHGSAFWSGYLGHHASARMTQAVVPGLTLSEVGEVLARERLLLALALGGIATAIWRRFSPRVDRFAGVWLLLCTAPLLASTTVLPHYLLPLTPALALFAVGLLPKTMWEHRLLPGLAGAVIGGALLAPAKLAWWLDPDFSPDEKAIGQHIARVANASDVVGTYALTSPSLVFYGGGLPVSIYADDPRFLEIQSAVLMNQRQAMRPGGVFDLRTSSLPQPGADARRFLVARAGAEARVAEQLLRTQQPDRALFRFDAGALSLVNDAGEGTPIPPTQF